MNTKDKKKWITVPVIAFMLLWALPSTAQQIAVKTNVLSDLGLVPNIGAELTVGEKTSLEFGLTGVIADPWGLDFDLTMGSFQYRYWIPNAH